MRFGSNGINITIDDGTGRLSAVAWNSESAPPLLPNLDMVHNSFVSIKGQLSVFRSEVQLKIESFQIIPDEVTEECLWWIDVKEEWETIAALFRRDLITQTSEQLCPCKCHSLSGTLCSTIGSPESLPHSFSRAVAVVCSALRSLASSQPGNTVTLSHAEMLDMIKENLSESLKVLPCYPDCASVESIRRLIRAKYISRSFSQPGKLVIHACPVQDAPSTITTSASQPRYPLTPSEYTQSLASQQPVVKFRGDPKFTCASLIR